MAEQRLMPESTSIEAFKRTVTQMISATKLTSHHVIERCTAPIIFVRAALEPSPEDPTMFDWSRHTTNGVNCYDVDTLHSAMWETQASRKIAEIIVNHLPLETAA